MTPECQGNYVVMRRHGLPSNGNKWLTLPQVRLYQTPNIIQVLEGQVTISAPASINANEVATNLITNLNSRSSGNGFYPIINSAGDRSTDSSCYRTSEMTLSAHGDILEITINLSKPFMIHCFLLV